MKSTARKPRIIISSDIGGNDPDDYQSLVHYLLYADLVDTEGLISSPPYGGRALHILETLECYKKDFCHLKHWGDYPSYDHLVGVTAQGALVTGYPGDNKSTEGSGLIVSAALREDPRPLYILIWGCMTDLAQALYDCPAIKSRIRVYSIGSWNTEQDSASRDYIFIHHRDLWWIESDETFRGMYMGGNQNDDLGNLDFVEQHVRGHGALGDFFASQKRDIKMGDTPSFLYILSPLAGGIGNWDDPTVLSWGGAFVKSLNGDFSWMDNPAPELTENGKKGAKTVNRWREFYLRDWQKRMDRCIERPIPPFVLK